MREMSKALVTGATRGPGRAVASALAAAGYETYALGRDRGALEALRADYGVIPMAIDLTDREAVRMIVEGMRPDILVHAALRWPAEPSFLHLSEADIDMALEVNLSATLHMTHTVLSAMRERRQGAVVLATPCASQSPTLLERMAEGAGRAFADALQSELSGSGVAVSAVCAGEAPFAGLVQSVFDALENAGMGPGMSKLAVHGNG